MKEPSTNRYLEIPVGGFRLVVADPPWSFLTYSEKGKGRSPEQHYGCMTLRALHRLREPLQRVMAPDALLLLWVVDPSLPAGIALGEEWLRPEVPPKGKSKPAYRTVAFTWTKEKPSGAEHLGNGYYTRANPEQCLLFRRGKGLPVQDRGVRQWLHAPVGRHSEKPEESYRRIERLFGDVPRIELFGRKERPGWHVLGDAIDGQEIGDALGALGEKV